jgi:hypothetical protein
MCLLLRCLLAVLKNNGTQRRERYCLDKAGRICHDNTLSFKGLDIRSRPLTFQLRVVALLLVDPIKKTERQDEVFARLLVGREIPLPSIISYGSPNTKGPSA